MTVKEVKQWLWQVRGIDREIETLTKTYRIEYARVTSVNAALDGVSVSGTKDPHKFDRLAELGDTIRQRTKDLTDAKNLAIKRINMLEDQRYHDVLMHYYVNCMTLEQIAVEMHYSFSQVKRLKFEAIQAMKTLLTETKDENALE